MSYVAIEKGICPVCGTTHEFGGGILIHKNLRDTDPEKTVTGYRLCKEHQSLREQGYLALVAVDGDHGDKLKMEDAYRLGSIVHLKIDVFNNIFDTPDIDLDVNPFVFCSQELVDHFKELLLKQDEESTDG